MKQIYINHKLFQDSILKTLEDSNAKSASGLLIGKREEDKAYIWDVMLTPDPEYTQPGLVKQEGRGAEPTVPLDQKPLVQYLSTKYEEFSFTDWLSEFLLSVIRFTNIIRNIGGEDAAKWL